MAPHVRICGSPGRAPAPGSPTHDYLESTHANESRCEVALEQSLQTEPLGPVPPLLERGHEHRVSTRDRIAKTGADARIEESVVIAEMCLAIRPYGRKNKLGICSLPEYGPS